MMGIHAAASCGGNAKTWAMSTVSAAALLAASFAAEAQAQSAPPNAPATQAAQAPAVEEIVVTGSRIIRDGYEAPTPVTVVGVEQIEQAALSNIADFVNQMPAFSGTQTTRDGGNAMTGGTIANNSLNLRGLGQTRTLTLLDGNRIVAGSPNGTVNINDFPQALVSRVDVVTGGASAAYGSDALSGVTNFVLDKAFVGIKGSIQGSLTSYGDHPTAQASLALGHNFGSGRGHIMLGTEYSRVESLWPVSRRPWNRNPIKIIANPAYAVGNGQPQFLIRDQVGVITDAPGGIIFSGPLKGTMFDRDGRPTTFTYGTLTNSTWTQGGDWRVGDVTQYSQSLEDGLIRNNIFARASFDVADNITVYAQFMHSRQKSHSNAKIDDSNGGVPGSPVRIDNPYLDPTIAARMAALKITSFVLGSFNLDLPNEQANYYRRMWSYAGGVEGTANLFDSAWKWSLHAQTGLNRSTISAYVSNTGNLALAEDPVRDPVSGNIVCRSTLTNPTNGCVPWNAFGWGHNSQKAIDYVKGNPTLKQQLRQDFYSASASGEAFSTWAGPVSLALGVEHRKESVTGYADPLALADAFITANYKPTIGSYTVTEGFVETVVPLAANKAWAKSLELNGAIRATSYSTSGYVTTWKLGMTYQPIDDLRFRFTRSRDIRAPNLNDLYAAGTAGRGVNLIDPFRNNAPVLSVLGPSSGNANLKPEVADTTGVGAVLQPAFFPGFNASVDMYDIKIADAIATVGSQDVIDLCFEGKTQFCGNITRNAAGIITRVLTSPLNFVNQETRGLDLEASYRAPLGSWFSSWNGNITLRALATRVFHLRTDNGYQPVADQVGNLTGSGPPKWRWTMSAAYNLDDFTASWTARGLSAGTYGPNYVQCTSGCPLSNPNAQTIDYNYIAGAIYHDLSFNYKFAHVEGAGVDIETTFAVTNLFDRDPSRVGSTTYWQSATNFQLFDTLGRTFRVALRFRM